jgi:hypothetical protein
MFNKLKKTSEPNKKFKKELLVQCANEYMPTKQSTFRFATSGVVALLVVFGLGTGVFAYESPSVVEGHPLNFVKENVEKVEEKLARSPEARAKFHARMSDRRFKEAKRFKGDDSRKADFLEKASAELDLSLEELKVELKDEDARKEIMEKLKESGIKHAPLFDKKGKDFKGKGIGPDVSEFRAELKELELEPEEMHEAMKEHMDELLAERLEKIKLENPDKYDEAVERAAKHKDLQERKREYMKNRVQNWKEKVQDRKDQKPPAPPQES